MMQGALVQARGAPKRAPLRHRRIPSRISAAGHLGFAQLLDILEIEGAVGRMLLDDAEESWDLRLGCLAHISDSGDGTGYLDCILHGLCGRGKLGIQ